MKKIKREEMESMLLRQMGPSTLLRVSLLSLKVGEILQVEPADWTWKSKSPSALCRRLESSRRKFKCLKSMEGKGWVIERLK